MPGEFKSLAKLGALDMSAIIGLLVLCTLCTVYWYSVRTVHKSCDIVLIYEQPVPRQFITTATVRHIVPSLPS